MDAFNYLAVLISIILGLGVTQLLSAFGRWIERRESFHVFAPSILWAAILLLIHVQTWWSMFGLRLLSDWTFLRFAVVLLQPITLFLMSVLALPTSGSDQIDLRSNYYNQRPWFFGLLAFLVLVSLAKDLVVSGALPGGLNLAFHAFLLTAAIIALTTQKVAYHVAVASACAVMMLAYVSLLFSRLH
jgi:hypothetical protein